MSETTGAPGPEHDPYPPARAEAYLTHHRGSLRNRLTDLREKQVLAQAIRAAVGVESAIDMPCGAGRFWSTIAAAGVRSLIAADVSHGMLGVAARNRVRPDFPSELLQLSAFETGLPTDCVDIALCLRFYHHLILPEDRTRLLAELKRISRRWVALSLWVDGNLRGNRRIRKQPTERTAGYGRRICRPRTEVEAEFRAAGFEIRGHYDTWPFIDMWRLYLLEAVND
jgi:SAM-dependent methyltransferase